MYTHTHIYIIRYHMYFFPISIISYLCLFANKHRRIHGKVGR